MLVAVCLILPGHARTFSAVFAANMRAPRKASAHALRRRRTLVKAPLVGHESAFNANDASAITTCWTAGVAGAGS